MNTPIASGFTLAQSRSLSDAQWQLCSSDARHDSPAQLLASNPCWHVAQVPGTVAQSLALPLHSDAELDKRDWWYRGQFDHDAQASFTELRFDGLATQADVWLNGEKILSSDNMYRGYRCDVSTLLREHNELFMCFRSLDAFLREKKSRPRWKTALVAQQNMRWMRTTLLGRVAAWMPAVPPIGPWRAIHLIDSTQINVEQLSLRADVKDTQKRVHVKAVITKGDHHATPHADLQIGDQFFPLTLQVQQQQLIIDQTITLSDAPLWWPHTHGEPTRLSCKLVFKNAQQQTDIDAGFIAFKSVMLNRANGQVKVLVNGVEVFLRGACWTINDALSLSGDRASLYQALSLAQQAGINMLRVGGTMCYESDAFYELCDELGILVWQDFMFANMDYPFGDEAFHQNVVAEVQYQLNRLQKHVCVAVYCGGSEVKQQAAMLGLSPSEWASDFFDRELPALCQQHHADIPYFPSSPCEGALPFHINQGIGHYYGVGAFRRPLNDVKLASVKFASECLGFSNVPDNSTAELLGDGLAPPPHDPRWKARVPRDPRAGLDFEDIREHYLRELFDLDPIALRSRDIERYYAVSRVVSGEVMHRVFAHWRQAHSQCGGGLVWFYKDLWPGAGWGIVNSTNKPKAAYYYLRRCFKSRAIFISDEGCNGLHLHAINENAQALNVVIGFKALQRGHIVVAHAEQTVSIDARSQLQLSGDAMLGYFADLNDAFKFGPAKHDVVYAYLKCAETGALLSDDFYFPVGMNLPSYDHVTINAVAQFIDANTVQVSVASERFLQSVVIEAKGFLPSDNYFHLAPGQQKTILFTATQANQAAFKGEMTALNSRDPLIIRSTFSVPQ